MTTINYLTTIQFDFGAVKLPAVLRFNHPTIGAKHEQRAKAMGLAPSADPASMRWGFHAMCFRESPKPRRRTIATGPIPAPRPPRTICACLKTHSEA